MPAVPPFLLQAVIDQHIVIDEQLWSLDQLRERLARMLDVPGYRLAWGFANYDLWVDFRLRDGIVSADWRCSECGRPNGLNSAEADPSRVLRWMSIKPCLVCPGERDRAFANSFGLDGDTGVTLTNARLDACGTDDSTASLGLGSGVDVDDLDDDDLAADLNQMLSDSSVAIVPSLEYCELATQLDEGDEGDVAELAGMLATGGGQ